MDGNMIKRVGLLLLGGTAGGILGYFLAEKIIEKLYNRQFLLEDEELDLVLKGLVPPKDSEDIKPLSKDTKKQDYTKFAKKDLAELAKPYTSSIDEEMMKENKVSMEKENKIYVIGAEEYESNRSFNKEPITYYEDDTTFSDLNEGIIDDPVRLFGPNVHLHFGEENEDPDIVCVRNENTGVDYEISRVHNSYSVLVMGMPAEEPKPKRRRNTKKVSAHDNDEDDETED